MLTFVGPFFLLPQLLKGEFHGAMAVVSAVVQYGMQLFILVFQFYMVNKIADSIEAEYHGRNLPVESRPTFRLGLFMCICSTATLIGEVPVIGFIGQLASIAGLVAWIMYWVKTAEWKNKIKFLPEDNSGESDLFKNLY